MSDLSKVIEIQKNRIRFLEREVELLEERLDRAQYGPAAHSMQDFEGAMECRFPDTQQATLLSQPACEVEPMAPVAESEESPATLRRRSPAVVEIALSK